MQSIMEQCKQVLEEHYGSRFAGLILYGSMARNQADASSDIDLLVRFATRKSLIALIGLERQLSAALERKVDLLTEAALSPYLRARILDDQQVIYETR